MLLRHDFERGTSQARSFGPGASLGEAVFVPREDGAGESDGWLLLLVHSAETDTSALHILNADDVEGEAAGRHRPAAAGAGGLPRQLGARPGLTDLTAPPDRPALG